MLGRGSHERPPAPHESTDGLISLLPLGLHRCLGAMHFPRTLCGTGSSPHDYSPQCCDWWGGAVILTAGWCGEARHPTPCVRSRSAEAPQLGAHRRLARNRSVRSLRSRSKRPSITTMLDRYGPSCPGWTSRSPRQWMGRTGGSSRERIARHAMTHIRWGRVRKRAAEIGRVTVKPPTRVAFRGRDRSTHNALRLAVVVAEHLLEVTP